MKIFVCEFFTGGGLARDPLPPSLAREGGMMAEALVGDLRRLPGIRVLASRDARLPPLHDVETIVAGPADDLARIYARGLAAADAAWPIAPETNGALERLARATLRAGRCLLGCRPGGIRTAASKRRTAAVLARFGVPVAPTFTASERLPDRDGPWVVKPDDGAGCEDTAIAPDRDAARYRLAANPTRMVAQPWIDGEPASLSVLCASGRSTVLAVNRQEVRIVEHSVAVDRLLVNAIADTDGRLAALAAAVVRAIPGLWGYIGIDLVRTPDGPVVLEVNPRLTTSYCGLEAALGLNVAELVLQLTAPDTSRERATPNRGRPVEIALAPSL